MFPLLILLFITVAEAGHAYDMPLDQASSLLKFKITQKSLLAAFELKQQYDLNSRVMDETNKLKQDHLLKSGLPGQPSSGVNFKQYAGEISVDRMAGRALFYYFAESTINSSTDPLILWLNGGPGCSSLGVGALTEIGPFGVNPDGQTLYTREFAWNKVANVLFLESPAGVGFSYSNTTSDYNITGDQRTAEDTYVFLMKWFEMYPTFKSRDFYLIGESYAGYYIPELADIILENVENSKDSTPMMNLKGIMIGNGLIDEESDVRGQIDFPWTHALISDEAHKEVLQKCTGGMYGTESCREAYVTLISEIEMLNFFNLYNPKCQPSLMLHAPTNRSDPCDLVYVHTYLNLPQVQAALNANGTKLPYTWMPCSNLSMQWHDLPPSMFPIYKRLMDHGLHILLYSGDVDGIVPVISTRYALAAMGLKVIEPWHWWTISNTSEVVAGFKVVYDRLTFATVLGAGHQVPLSYPDRLFHLLKNFLGKL